MTQENAGSSGYASGELTTNDGATSPPPPLSVRAVGEENVAGQFCAVINVHDCNLQQIEVAIEANRHEVDPHPAGNGQFVRRHPVYLVAYDPTKLDEQGRPVEGQPSELNLTMIRQIFSARPRYQNIISPDPLPEDGSHIQVEGMHFVPEFDSAGNATGRVRLGNPSDIPSRESAQP